MDERVGASEPEERDGEERHAEPAPGIGALGIGQVGIGVRDLARATKFYKGVLGLEYLFSAPPGLAFFRSGEVRLMLSAAEEEGGALPATLLYYTVADVDRGHERLVASGTDVVAPPHVVHRTDEEELWMGFYRDGEGNLFATMEERGPPKG
jgi:methylmalonyl-CoA/ethylmalonyl-CoA epimerase